MGGIGFCLKNAGFVRKLKIYRQWAAMFYVGAGTVENGDMFFEHHYATHKKPCRKVYIFILRGEGYEENV